MFCYYELYLSICTVLEIKTENLKNIYLITHLKITVKPLQVIVKRILINVIIFQIMKKLNESGTVSRLQIS